MANQNILELKEVIKDENFVFRFSQYQRSFEWEHENVKYLYESISKNLHFGVGTFKGTETDGEIEVIDGQQRLTAIAIIFGGITNSLKFKFNFDSDLNNNDINDAINGDHVDEPENSYIKYLINLKDSFKKYRTDNNISNAILELLWEGINFPLVEIKTNRVEESFIAMNTSGKEVDKLEIAKAYAVKNANGRDKKIIIKIWNEFIFDYHDIRLSASKAPSKSQLFNQAVSFAMKDDVKITNRNIEEFAKIKYFKTLLAYTKWAKNILPGDKIVKRIEILSFVNHNNKINPYSPILSYHISNLKLTPIAKKKTAYILLGVLNNLSYLGDEALSTYKDFFIEIIKIKAIDAIIAKISERISSIAITYNPKMVSSWNEAEQLTFLRYGRTKKYPKNSVDSVISKYLVLQLEIIRKTIVDKTYSYGESIHIGDDVSVEHILNYTHNKFEYTTLIDVGVNNRVGSEIALKRPAFIEQRENYPYKDVNPLNSLENAIDILENAKSINQYKDEFVKSWKI